MTTLTKLHCQSAVLRLKVIYSNRKTSVDICGGYLDPQTVRPFQQCWNVSTFTKVLYLITHLRYLPILFMPPLYYTSEGNSAL